MVLLASMMGPSLLAGAHCGVTQSTKEGQNQATVVQRADNYPVDKLFSRRYSKYLIGVYFICYGNLSTG